MKLHKLLGRILTDVALRQSHPSWGVCMHVGELSEWDVEVESKLEQVIRAVGQTYSVAYPVAGYGEYNYHAAFLLAAQSGSLWRGEYGLNRRKFLRDAWRLAKELDL